MSTKRSNGSVGTAKKPAYVLRLLHSLWKYCSENVSVGRVEKLAYTYDEVLWPFQGQNELNRGVARMFARPMKDRRGTSRHNTDARETGFVLSGECTIYIIDSCLNVKTPVTHL